MTAKCVTSPAGGSAHTDGQPQPIVDAGGLSIRPVRVCHVLASFGQGGLEKHVVDLTGRLAQQGHTVSLVAHPGFADRLDPGVTLLPMKLDASRWNPLLVRKLRKVLMASGCQIVHAQANKAAALVSKAITPRAACGALPSVATIHNVKRHTSMFNRFDRVIAVSPLAAGNLSHSRVEVILNGMQPPQVPAEAQLAVQRAALCQQLDLSPQRPLLISVGRLVAAKGFDLLLKAMAEVDANLLIVGDGPQREELKTACRGDDHLAQRVRLLGHRTDVPSLLAMSDLVVISSRREGFSYVMNEALHLERVILSTRVGGPAVLLPENFLVEPGDVVSLGRRICQILKSPQIAQRAFEPVWQMAATTLTLDAMAQRTAAVYTSVLAG